VTSILEDLVISQPWNVEARECNTCLFYTVSFLSLSMAPGSNMINSLLIKPRSIDCCRTLPRD